MEGRMILFMLLILLPAAAGDTIFAESCEHSSVQSAVASAGDGDEVVIPGGDCVWNSPLLVGETVSWNPKTYRSKSITLKGEGTVITSSLAASEDLIEVMMEEGKPVRITGFTIKSTINQNRCQRAISIGGAEGWRIDNMVFDNRGAATPGCGIIAYSYGLIDSCAFLDTYTSVASVGTGDLSWSEPLSLGSLEAVYIENNVMNNTAIMGDGATDAYGGARYVLRHNTILNARAGHHGLDSGGYRSPHSFEIYDNTFIWTVPNTFYTWRARGGTGVIFGNNLTGLMNEKATFGVVNYRTCCCTPEENSAQGCSCQIPPCHNNCGTWGRCDGDNERDGNLDSTGWPCQDQVGRTTDSDMDGIQDYAPLYEWDNTANGKDADITTNDPWGCSSPSMQDHLKDGRDYKNDERMPGYLPLAYPHPLRRGICDIASLLDTLSGWKKGEKDIRTLMEAIAEWKSGC